MEDTRYSDLQRYFHKQFRRKLQLHSLNGDIDANTLDELVQAALIRYWKAEAKGKTPHKAAIVQWVWADYWREEEKKPSRKGLDTSGEDSEGSAEDNLLGASSFHAIVLALVPDYGGLSREEIIRRYNDVGTHGNRWAQLARLWRCSPREAERWTREDLPVILDIVAQKCGCGDAGELLRKLYSERLRARDLQLPRFKFRKKNRKGGDGT